MTTLHYVPKKHTVKGILKAARRDIKEGRWHKMYLGMQTDGTPRPAEPTGCALGLCAIHGGYVKTITFGLGDESYFYPLAPNTNAPPAVKLAVQCLYLAIPQEKKERFRDKVKEEDEPYTLSEYDIMYGCVYFYNDSKEMTAKKAAKWFKRAQKFAWSR